MIYSTITNKAMVVGKIKVSLTNIQAQLKLERVSSQAKDTKVNSLEDMIIKLGYDPNDVNAAKEIIRRKNACMVALKK